MIAGVSYTPNGAFMRHDVYCGEMCIFAGQVGANHHPGQLRPWSVWWGINGGPRGAGEAVMDDFGTLQMVKQ